MAPFMRYQAVSPEFKESFNKEKLLSPEASPDRAMLVETNTSAWEERIRLMDLARERIILSTFDMRDGESTRDLLSVLLHKADEGVSGNLWMVFPGCVWKASPYFMPCPPILM